MADEDNTSSPEDTGGTTHKKAKKKAAKKKVAKKKVAKKAASSASTEAPASAAPPAAATASRATSSPPPAVDTPVPQAAVADPEMFGDDQDASMSGWLVMWGPLIIIGFLILVFMGGEGRPLPMEAVPLEPEVTLAPVTAPEEPRLDISPERAAADLAEAFKAAGIPLPGEDSETTAAAPAPELPPELQANPWAPAPGQAPAAPPPPPGYGGYPYGYGQPMAPPGYGYGGPPPGYGYGAPPPRGYGWGAPGYGPPPMGYGAPGYPMHQGMGQGMGPGMGQGMRPGMGQGMRQGMPQQPMPGYGAPPPAPPSTPSQ